MASEGDGDLQLVGAEVGEEAAHEAAVVDLADDVVVGLLGAGLSLVSAWTCRQASGLDFRCGEV